MSDFSQVGCQLQTGGLGNVNQFSRFRLVILTGNTGQCISAVLVSGVDQIIVDV